MNYKSYLPLLDIYIRLPFIEFETVLVRGNDYNQILEYIGFRFKIYKWSFSGRLYDTKERIKDRKKEYLNES